MESVRAQELCESQGGHPGLPVPNSPYSLCGHKATLNEPSGTIHAELQSCVNREVVLSSWREREMDDLFARVVLVNSCSCGRCPCDFVLMNS